MNLFSNLYTNKVRSQMTNWERVHSCLSLTPRQAVVKAWRHDRQLSETHTTKGSCLRLTTTSSCQSLTPRQAVFRASHHDRQLSETHNTTGSCQSLTPRQAVIWDSQHDRQFLVTDKWSPIRETIFFGGGGAKILSFKLYSSPTLSSDIKKYKPWRLWHVFLNTQLTYFTTNG